MVSKSRSSINIALVIMVMLMSVCTIKGQLSNVPHRYRRHKFYYNKPEDTGGKQRQRKGQQQQNRRTLDGDLSIPMEEVELDRSDQPSDEVQSPPKTNLRMMSIPLQESDFDLSMPMGKPPARTDGGDSERIIDIGNSNNSDEGSIVLSGLLASMSALVVGAMALFVKMRQLHQRQLEEESVQVVSPANSASVTLVQTVSSTEGGLYAI